MVTEDYVSFETAKLLKEKGFDSEQVGCFGGFYSERAYQRGYGMETESGIEVGIVYDDLRNADLDYDEYLRPTIQMAMKWLRNIHGLFIHIDVVREASCWLADIQDIKGDVSIYPVEKEFPNYEEACEAAIKYCLENLI